MALLEDVFRIGQRKGPYKTTRIMRELIDRESVTFDQLIEAAYPIDSDDELPEDFKNVVFVLLNRVKARTLPGWRVVKLKALKWSLQREEPSS